jgi:hypothetical protein
MPEIGCVLWTHQIAGSNFSPMAFKHSHGCCLPHPSQSGKWVSLGV